MRSYFLPRPIHPFAWWGFAICLGIGASITTNPLLLLAIIAVACAITFARRGDNPWAKGFVFYLGLAAFIVVLRIVYRIVFGGGDGPTILFRLPEIALPGWVGGIRLLGPVSLESILTGLYDGLRLATIIVALGAANSLANPKKLLASLPAALYETGTVLVVSLNIFPQLGDSMRRVRRARKLRRSTQATNRRQRLRVVQTIIVPVLTDALDRSLQLAAAMDSRGYGRHATQSLAARRLTALLALVGLVLFGLGAFLLLSPGASPQIGGISAATLALVAGIVGSGWAMQRSGRGVNKTSYRPIRWSLAETTTLACGVGLVLAILATPESFLAPAINPFTWPELNPTLLLGLLVAFLPAVLTPPPSLATSKLRVTEGLS